MIAAFFPFFVLWCSVMSICLALLHLIFLSMVAHLLLLYFQINDRYEFSLQLDLDRDNGKYLSPDADRSVRNLYTLHRYIFLGFNLCAIKIFSMERERESLLGSAFSIVSLLISMISFLAFFQCSCSQRWSQWRALLCIYSSNTLRAVVCSF